MEDVKQKVTEQLQKFVGIFKNIQWLEIPATTYVRWILTILVAINTTLAFFDLSIIPFNESRLAEFLTIIINLIILIINTYKNNSTSKEAIIADKIMHALKAADETVEDTAIGKLNDVLNELNSDTTY